MHALCGNLAPFTFPSPYNLSNKNDLSNKNNPEVYKEIDLKITEGDSLYKITIFHPENTFATTMWHQVLLQGCRPQGPII